MSNETTTFILDYAEVHRDFSLGDLFAYLQEKTGIKKSSLSWNLFKLVNENVLVRTGRGTYAKVMKQVFSPQPIEEVKEVVGEYKGSASADGYSFKDGTKLNLSEKDQEWSGLKVTFKF